MIVMFLSQESIVYLKRYLSALENANNKSPPTKRSDVEKKLADYERRLRELQMKLNESEYSLAYFSTCMFYL